MTGHAVPASLVDDMFALARRFFALPLERKMEVHFSKSVTPLYPRGYFRLEEETLVYVGATDAGAAAAVERYGISTDPTVKGDYKEGYDFAKETPLDGPVVTGGNPFHGPNLSPADMPEFRATVMRYYEAMIAVGHTLCRSFAIGLGVGEDFFAERLKNPMGIYRMLYYPPQRGQLTERQLGTAAHTDYGVVSMLAQDEVGGLQVRNSAGAWIAAPPIPDTFICNLGEAMARWTNDRFAATLHRVINLSGRERYSIPFFFDPDHEAEVRCLESCQGPDDPPHYPPHHHGRDPVRPTPAGLRHLRPRGRAPLVARDGAA